MTQYTPYTIKTSLKSILFIPQKSAGVFFLLLLQKLLFATVTANERDLFIASYTDKKRNAHNKNILYLCQQKKKKPATPDGSTRLKNSLTAESWKSKHIKIF